MTFWGLQWDQGASGLEEHPRPKRKQETSMPDPTQRITALNERAAQLRREGRHQEAVTEAEQALSLAESELGENHPDTVRALNNLGALLREQGDLPGARRCLERAVALSERVLGNDHFGTATSFHGLGNVLFDQGHLREARSYLERAQAIFRRILGDSHAGTIQIVQTLRVLDQLLQTFGDQPEVLEKFMQSLRKSGTDSAGPA
jgi:tetratricopeptide (TPR) repeat protein